MVRKHLTIITTQKLPQHVTPNRNKHISWSNHKGGTQTQNAWWQNALHTNPRLSRKGVKTVSVLISYGLQLKSTDMHIITQNARKWKMLRILFAEFAKKDIIIFWHLHAFTNLIFMIRFSHQHNKFESAINYEATNSNLLRSMTLLTITLLFVQTSWSTMKCHNQCSTKSNSNNDVRP